MLLTENKYTNVSGTFPNALMIDASGAGLTDGSEFAALPLNDGWEPFSQAIMSYAAGVQLQNVPTGSVGVPNGVADAVGVSQMLEALQKSIGNGPGNYTLWANDDDPSITGDRVILLAEQGVLVAVYPGLDAANWIGGNTAAQVAAIAAGQKFYRSSDAAGLVGDAAGPYIQLPAQPYPSFLKQYSLTITAANWTTDTSAGIPYRTVDGTWRLIFNISGDFSNTPTDVPFTFTGVTFATGFQSISASQNTTTARSRQAWVSASSARIIFSTSVPAGINWFFSGDVELASKPTWADDFEYQWGIRY